MKRNALILICGITKEEMEQELANEQEEPKLSVDETMETMYADITCVLDPEYIQGIEESGAVRAVLIGGRRGERLCGSCHSFPKSLSVKKRRFKQETGGQDRNI